MIIRVGSVMAAVGNVFTARGEGYALLLVGMVIVAGFAFLAMLARGAGRGK